ncbi:MAG: iron-sulfur cluster assembly scaffold protein [Anaerolineae bacterium]|nr:iron-sulfur cluster assembly scaffold protein [Anaerolineae bacterium]
MGLQDEIDEAAEDVYSATVIDHARHPRNLGGMLDPDGQAAARSSCGDTMAIFLRLNDSRIEMASFLTDGCGATLACGSMLTTMVRGMTLEEAAAVEASDVILALGGLPPENVHCAVLAVVTLQHAMARCGHKGPQASAIPGA